MQMTDPIRWSTGLPDPDTERAFYDDVPTKRLLAWFVDMAIVAVITSVVAIFSLFALVLLLPLWLTVDFLYRWWTLSSDSATWGMRLMAIEVRRPDGDRLDGATAFFHTAGYLFSIVTFPLQLISIATMLMTERRQSLTDLLLGTAAVNLKAR